MGQNGREDDVRILRIFFVDTKKQHADMLTKGNFTRDELDHLLRLLNIMIFSMFHCSHSLSNRKLSAMSKKSARRFFWRGFGSGKTETDEFGVKELPERKENSPQDSSASNSPGNQELDQSHACFTRRQELMSMIF